ncbi:hypothetical protein TWF106_009849 [Orbilia oligospora]|uniref:Protein kinase domain-containing protein n=1 Tax=Orbilia oligospora TaxID=2813651 RepID=A0A7C8QWW9_ORBOL|nr:hypothetical protein TWF191_007656 [Orbilia oligospora]KAF3227331.1 hypothetical protein TWF106_009849 [Orbilia oligospora]
MTRCRLQSLIQQLGSAHDQGFPIKGIRTWQPYAYDPAHNPSKKQSKYEQYSFPKSELRKFIENLDDDTLRGLLFPTCNCESCKLNLSSAMFHVTTATVSEASFPISPLKGLILESYLSSFVWLIENGAPWYILYLLVNELKDSPNALTKSSLDRFGLEVLDTNQKIRRSHEGDVYKIESSIGGINVVLYIDEKRARESGTGILGCEQYMALNSSHPRYFMRDLLAQPRALHIFEDHDCLPILGNVKPLKRVNDAKGEALIYFANIEGLESIPPPAMVPQTRTFKSHPFAIKIFVEDDLTQGLREWISVSKALEITSKASLDTILAPLSAFCYRGNFCLVYPRAIYSLERHLTPVPTNPDRTQRPNIQIQEAKLWYQLAKIAVTLELLHKNGHYHLDITLANLLVFGNGDLKICDFGESGVSTSDLPWIEGLATPKEMVDMEELIQTRTGNPPARTLSNEFKSQRENTRGDCLKSYDIYCFGQVCFETAAYTMLGWKQSKLIERLVQEHGGFEKFIRKGAFYRRCEHTGNLVNKDIIEELLQKLAICQPRTTFDKSAQLRRRSKENIDYHGISNIIRNLISPSIPVRLNQGSNLPSKILQCLPYHPDLLHPALHAKVTSGESEIINERSVNRRKGPISSTQTHSKWIRKFESSRGPSRRGKTALKVKDPNADTRTPRWLRFLRPRPPEPLVSEGVVSVPVILDEEVWNQSSTNLINGESCKYRTENYPGSAEGAENYGCLSVMRRRRVLGQKPPTAKSGILAVRQDFPDPVIKKKQFKKVCSSMITEPERGNI